MADRPAAALHESAHAQRALDLAWTRPAQLRAAQPPERRRWDAIVESAVVGPQTAWTSLAACGGAIQLRVCAGHVAFQRGLGHDR